MADQGPRLKLLPFNIDLNVPHLESLTLLRLKTLGTLYTGTTCNNFIVKIGDKIFEDRGEDDKTVFELCGNITSDIILVDKSAIQFIQQPNDEAQPPIAREVHENLMEAGDRLPEGFAMVSMLYVKIRINNVDVLGLIDTGAQTSTMDMEGAKLCKVDRLIDPRFEGLARGVGDSKVLGKIHCVDMQIGMAEIPISLVVVNGQNVPILIGLDVFRRYRCVIDLGRNTIKFNDMVECEFLSEFEIGAYLKKYGQNA